MHSAYHKDHVSGFGNTQKSILLINTIVLKTGGNMTHDYIPINQTKLIISNIIKLNNYAWVMGYYDDHIYSMGIYIYIYISS